LAIALSVTGAIFGLSYLPARRAMPKAKSLRVGGYGLITAAVGAALLVLDHPSCDYTSLQPTWLAVALFILVPTAYGVLRALIVATFAVPPPATFPGPLPRLWRSRPVTVLAVTVYVALVAWGAYNILADIVSLAVDHESSAPFTL
jgi:hypothetical protein